MKIKFNTLNAVIETDTTDEALRQGNIGNTLTAKFEGKNNVNFTATINYTRSDGTKISDVFMLQGDNSDEFKYTFANPWFFALSGETTLTVYLHQNGNVIASGQITFDIEQTDAQLDPTITYEQYEALLEAIMNKQDKYSPNNVRSYSVLTDAENDLENLAVNQVVYITDTKLNYVVLLDGNEEKYLKQLSTGAVVHLVKTTTGETTREGSGNIPSQYLETFKNSEVLMLVIPRSVGGTGVKDIYSLKTNATYQNASMLEYRLQEITQTTELGVKKIKFTIYNVVVSTLQSSFQIQRTIYTTLSEEAINNIVSSLQTDIDSKLNKTSSANKIYGTDDSGEQTTYGIDTTPTTDSDNLITSGGVKTAIEEAVTNVYKFRGNKTVAQLNALSVDSSMNGYVYNISDDGTLTQGSVAVVAGDNVVIVWDSDNNTFSWDKFTGSFSADLSDYIRKDEFNYMNTTTDVEYVMED